MTIKVGDRLPSVKLKQLTADGMKDLLTDEAFAHGRSVLFAVPGAFTPTCSAKHVPSFVNHAETLKGKGVERIACVSVNDAFVMAAWGKDQHAEGKVMMLADGNGELAKALGLEVDLGGFGLGIRSQRYAMVIEDGVVRVLNVEKPGAYEVSSAEAVLAAL
jgi:peroxiredoxin